MTRRQLQLSGTGADHRRGPMIQNALNAMMDQVSEDFQRILTLHNEIVRAIAADISSQLRVHFRCNG